MPRIEGRDSAGQTWWWEIAPFISYAEKKEIAKALTVDPDYQAAVQAEATATESERRLLLLRQLDSIHMAWMLRCTSAWSFEQPLSAETINALDSLILGVVIADMERRYTPRTAAEETALKNA